jgi:putative FmdB family regulatory protein
VPAYDYQCLGCGRMVEVRHTMTWPGTVYCQACGHEMGKRYRVVPQITPSSMPNRRNDVAPPVANNSWERGYVVQHRPDGSEMPYIDGRTGKRVRVKKWAQHRRHYEEQIRRVTQGEPDARNVPG